MTAVKPTEVFDHVETIARIAGGFLLQKDRGHGFVCIPTGRSDWMGYGSTPFLAVADCANQLRLEEANR